MNKRVLINGAVLRRDQTPKEAEACVKAHKTFVNSNGKEPQHLKNANYDIVDDVGPVPPSKLCSYGTSQYAVIDAKPGDLDAWLRCIDKMPRGPFGPIK